MRNFARILRGLTIVVLIGLCTSGCVRRRLTVRTNPPGAVVYVDDQEIGTSPVSTSFTYYGTRKLHVVKDGFESVTIKQTFNPPWYEYPGLDFVSENVVPWETRDERVVDVVLQPQQITPPERILERAQSLRSSAGQGVVAPLVPPTVAPAPGPP